MNLWQRWKQTTLANQLMVITTAIVAFGTVFYVVVAIFQWQLMKESGKQTSAQIDKLVDQSKRIADTSSETARQAKVALDATIENFHLEQRAWIGPDKFLWDEYLDEGKKIIIKEGKPFRFRVSITNNGKTPARKVRGTIAFQILKATSIPDFEQSTKSKVLQQTSGIMQPGAIVFLDISPNNYMPTTSVITGLRNGHFMLYVSGVITYEDVFGLSHFTKYCQFLIPDLTGVAACPTGNEAN